MKSAIGSLTLALTLIVAPAATQSTSAAAEGPRLGRVLIKHVNVCFTLQSGHPMRSAPCPLCANRRHSDNHSINLSARDNCRRHIDAELLGALDVDGQFECGRLLHRQVDRSRSWQA